MEPSECEAFGGKRILLYRRAGVRMKRIDKQFDFIREIDKEKEITRHTFLADASRRENDAEHAWQMANKTILLQE